MAQITITARTAPGIIGHRLKTKKTFCSHDSVPAALVRCAAELAASVVGDSVMFTGYEYLTLGSTNTYSRSSASTTTT